MHWRFYIFLLSAVAAFCFMLLTAVTDYGSGNRTRAPLSSATAARETSRPQLSALVTQPAPVVPAGVSARSAHPQPIASAPLTLKPNQPHFFVPSGADPVAARRDAELEEKANRGKPAFRKKLKWDDNGWYREEVALVTAYCPCTKCCGSSSQGITSIGKNAWTPGLAADPECLDYGAKVFVPGYGLSVVDDTGGAMRRHWRRNGLLHIDVRMTYHYEARQWGKQYLRVKIYETD